MYGTPPKRYRQYLKDPTIPILRSTSYRHRKLLVKGSALKEHAFETSDEVQDETAAK